MRIARSATSWQSIRLDVPVIDVCLPLGAQTDALIQIFQAAAQLRAFYLKHEGVLLSIPALHKESF